MITMIYVAVVVWIAMFGLLSLTLELAWKIHRRKYQAAQDADRQLEENTPQ